MTRVSWRSPQVLLALFVFLLAAAYALRARPPERAPAPALSLEASEAPAPELQETVLYAVDEEGVARPIVRELPAPDDASLYAQGLVDALRDALRSDGVWPEGLPSPRVFAFDLARTRVAVLDLPESDVRLNVSRERAILASLERTLFEHGVERVAFLRGGEAAPAWLGTVTVPAGLD